MWVYACVWVRIGQWIPWSWSFKPSWAVWYGFWELKLGCSGRAGSTLWCWVISPATLMFFKMIWFSFNYFKNGEKSHNLNTVNIWKFKIHWFLIYSHFAQSSSNLERVYCVLFPSSEILTFCDCFVCSEHSMYVCVTFWVACLHLAPLYM